MPPPETPVTPFVDSVLHATDLSSESEGAFAHALAIALIRKARLTLLHVGTGTDPEDHWSRFPSVRRALERWGVLEEGSPRSAVVDQLRMAVTKVGMRGSNALRATLDYLDEHPTDLLVLATEARGGVPRWLRPSTAERLARRADTMTLFVPKSRRGFVCPDTGDILLQRLLVPVDHEPSPTAALIYAARTAEFLGEPPMEIDLLHVGDHGGMPELKTPEIAGVKWRTVHREGEVVGQIVGAAEEDGANLIVMATRGHDGILDAVRGSVTEQVLRRAPCPLLAIPAV